MSNQDTYVTMPDGTKVEVTPQTVTTSSLVNVAQLTSEDRLALDKTKRIKQEIQIVQLQHGTFKKMDLHSPDLDTLVSLNTNLETTERHFAQYDLLQIFQIIKPLRDSKTGMLTGMIKSEKESKNLFQWYGSLTLDEVKESTEWYCTCAKASWYKSNLSLTAEYLRRHMDVDLCEKVNEEYNKLPALQKGGPTMLHLMISHLLSSTDSLVHALTSKIKSLKLSSYPGEDVGKAVTHLRTLVRCLKKLKRRNAEGHEIDLVPHDLTKQLYDILQTSSCEEFNAMFRSMYFTNQQKILSKGVSAWEDPEMVLSAAQTHYHNLCTDGKWTGVSQNNATFPAFSTKRDAVAFLSELHCHNCGGPHLLRHCTKPHDKSRIRKNRKRFEELRTLAEDDSSSDDSSTDSSEDSSTDASKQHSNRRSKWPPRPKRGEPNHATIDGKQYYYHFKSRRWRRISKNRDHTDEDKPDTKEHPSSSTPAPAPVPDSSKLSSTQRRQANLVLSQFQQEFNDAFSVLTEVFHV
ncbi:hypothetical protein IV203_032720 [Nitzschia inconspicua]|uniref:Uncharacterized protein n=1 Tax=Nitzschia inconspicua TaxID=303405 RepID=A0A9K3KL96_9STRA|nr:hypothetical protein IV203_032720 [Nitzschia inconspicua]